MRLRQFSLGNTQARPMESYTVARARKRFGSITVSPVNDDGPPHEFGIVCGGKVANLFPFRQNKTQVRILQGVGIVLQQAICGYNSLMRLYPEGSHTRTSAPSCSKIAIFWRDGRVPKIIRFRFERQAQNRYR
jgi:hypothetical protein